MNGKEDISFRKEIFRLSLPIALQNLLSAAVTSADVVMTGLLGQDALSAVSLAGQAQFVLNLILLGLTLGTSLLAAQYFGKGDMETVGDILSIGLFVSALVSVFFAAASVGLPQGVMRIFTNEETLIAIGGRYLRIVGISYLFTAASQIFQAVFRATGSVRTATAINMTSLILNILLNTVLMFGWFIFPKCGVSGAALGTFLSRGAELVFCLLYFRKSGIKRRSGKLSVRASLRKAFWKYTLPITLNGLSWGTAFSMYSVILGHLGSDMVAANGIATVVRNFAIVGCNGLAGGAGIWLGNRLGRDEIEEAKADAKRILRLTFWLGVCGGILILLLSPLIMSAAGNLTGAAKTALRIMLYINAAYIVTKAMNVTFNNGFFCSGGDTMFGLIIDTIDMWGVFVPLGMLAAFVWKLPPMAVYAIISFDELTKIPVSYLHYRTGKWARNVTVENG